LSSSPPQNTSLPSYPYRGSTDANKFTVAQFVILLLFPLVNAACHLLRYNWLKMRLCGRTIVPQSGLTDIAEGGKFLSRVYSFHVATIMLDLLSWLKSIPILCLPQIEESKVSLNTHMDLLMDDKAPLRLLAFGRDMIL
jgi:hypothetical protein